MTQKAGSFLITHARVRELLSYDSETGELTWVKHRYRVPAGTRAGYGVKKGYRRITIDGKEYAEHRLIWFWVTGRNPKLEVDHKDGNPSNNSWGNLRLATGMQNAGNSNFRRKNKTGFRGVRQGYAPRQPGNFYAVITINKKQKNLGYFATAKDAHEAYKKAAKALRKEFYRESFPDNGAAA